MGEIDWGRFDIVLSEYLELHNISKNKLAAAANLQRSQLISYCKNEVQRPDLGVLARICCVLNCELSDIIKYCPPLGKHPAVKECTTGGVGHE
ncbi:MAG: helix-turn-helix transcriptional regulator [Sporomusaceae bacterium]|nr:helix-turn-helix transcriptional regulator [Sporomusaceae bacterium]